MIKRARGVFVRCEQLAGSVQLVKGRTVLDRELIERKMLSRLREGARELARPGIRRLPGARVDEIERITVENGTGDRDRIERLARRMQAPERAQRGIVQSLQPDRDPVNSGVAKAREPRGLDAGRIGLQRDLGMMRDGPAACDGLQDGAD